MVKKTLFASMFIGVFFASLFHGSVFALNNDPVKITVYPDNPGVVFDLMNFDIDLKYQDGSSFDLPDNPDPDGLFLAKVLYVESGAKNVIFSEKLYKNNPAITVFDGGNRLRVDVDVIADLNSPFNGPNLPPGDYTVRLVDFGSENVQQLGVSNFTVVSPPMAEEIVLSENMFIEGDIVSFYLFSKEENVAYVPLRYPFDAIPPEGRNYLSNDWDIQLLNSGSQKIKSVSEGSIFWEDDGSYSFKVDFVPGKYKLALKKVDELFFVYLTVVVKGSDPVDAGDDDEVREDMGEFELVAEADRCADFFDVDKKSKFCDAIVWAKQNGVVKGYFDGTFRPDKDINRVELLKVVLESLSIEIGKYDAAIDGSLGFKDVLTDQWYMPYVKVGQAFKIFVGDAGRNTARPADTVNRVEAVKLAFEGLRVADGYQLPVCEIKTYDDADNTQWYYQYTCKIKQHGLFDLINAKLLVPGKLSSRGEVVLMLYRLSQAGFSLGNL